MKLAKFRREAIARAIIEDIPAPDTAEVERDVQAALVKAMSAPVRKLYKTNAKALRVVYLNSEHGVDWNTPVIAGDAADKAVLAPFKEAVEARRKLAADIRCGVDACTTLKQLQERYPEFESYFPKPDEPNKYPLVVQDDLAKRLAAIGWPKKGAQ